jgi:hypothetical protein
LTATIVIGAILAAVFFGMAFLVHAVGDSGAGGMRLGEEIPSADGKYVAGYVRWTTDATVMSEAGDTEIYVRRSGTPFALDKNGNVLPGQQTAYSYVDNHAYDLKVAWTGKHTLHIWPAGCDNEEHSKAAGELQWEEMTIRFRNCERATNP